VEQVLFAKSGSISKGTVHLTAHHIIFRYDDAEEKEMWVSGLVVTASLLAEGWIM
jgi:myotubularin-related protein 6/7/8